ncbi:MAG: GNAT family N-acetyltransferase [Armatimonadetes bacterium]|nr:GNAT family N-acetyltransferase [Armatimonadota bacterium]
MTVELVGTTSVDAMTKDELVAEKEQLEQHQAELNSRIGRAKQRGEDPSALIDQNRRVSSRIKRIVEALAEDESGGVAGSGDALRTDVLTTTEAFCDLRGEWGKLISKSDIYSPFMMWEWLYAWWQFFGHNKRLRLITVRDSQNRLVGLAPMMLGFTEDNRCDRRILAFVGSGEEGPRGQYFAFVLAKEHRDSILRAIVERLRELRAEWRIIKLWRLRGDNFYHALLDVLTQYEEVGVSIERHGAAVHGHLSGSMEDFIDSVPSKTKRNYLRNQGNKLKAKYARVRHEVCDSVQQLPRFINTIHKLNIRRHEAKREDSGWASSRRQQCYEQMAKLLYERSCFRAELLWIDDKPVAGRAGIVRNETYFAYESGFAPEFAQDRVGVVALACCIGDCIRRGLTHFDWLSGHDYMQQYFGQEQTLLQLTVFHNSSPSLRYVGSDLWLRGIKQEIKKVLPWSIIKAVKRLLHGVKKR